MKVNEKISEVLFSAEEIRQRIKQVAAQISADFAGKDPLVVGVLKGAWVFLADLTREMSCDCQVDFISVSSYGNSTTSSGKITVRKDISSDCSGRNVLIVEDIVDTGVTLAGVKEIFRAKNAKSIKVASFLSKPSRRKVQVDVDYVCFEVPDKFVVGYGMDYAEYYRGLEDLCVLSESEYSN